MNRREFLFGSAAATLSSRLFAVPAGAPLAGEARLKLGIMSDVHLRTPGDETALVKALAWFRDHGADGVMIAGDIADSGRIEQLRRLADAWWTAFPGGKAPDGRKVEQLFVYGNHDIDGWTWGASKERQADPDYRAQCLGADNNRRRAWKELFREEYSPIWLKTVKGYAVVGMHWGEQAGLEKFFADHAAQLSGAKPFFYAQHAHPKDTCLGPWAWGAEPLSTKVLSKFPNAVAFSGHSHYSLTDERTVWQGAFTSVNTSSMRYSSLDYNLRDNAPGNGWGYQKHNAGHLTPQVPTGEGQQALFLTVTDEAMRLKRLEFHYGAESLGDDWVIPVASTPTARPFAFEPRAAKRSAPAFAAGAAVKVEKFSADGPKGKDGQPTKVARVRVTWPAAKSVNGCRVFEYEVQPLVEEDSVALPLAAKRVLAYDFHLAEARATREGQCVFALSDFPPSARIRFEVRPVECFGRKGQPISSVPDVLCC